MKSKTYSRFGKLLEDCKPSLGQLGEALMNYAVSSGKQFLVEREQRESIKENIGEEYFQLTGKETNDLLKNYISSSVNQGWQLYQEHGEKRAELFTIDRLKKAKDDFTLEAKVVSAIDAKVEYLENK
ncbi:hypothetical protein HOE37_05300 [Candidatus Woesearchaeota archaeon]|jgi:hypothetical protein|nr:hypothetical protein [Candidatus Woesearchaeota archaeon]MBT4111248.1 hypothetical protein [Candidatus Woesearchaeota archaeon]MBT4336828.1 hypothetical protein [Candidatus Woesearchaeota archaeon]MBT4469496.1 hypothetical protein [Candidatus Woesearchaeota archaeon]MBT6744109.1 hypothetical protein [Candidatus Woesearchaeota archaeon]